MSIDDVHGWDGLQHDNIPQDEYGHGTLCSSVMAASGNNGKLLTGVNWRVKIVPIRFFSGDNTTTSEAVLECFDYIIALRKSGVNLRAVNCSFGAPLNDFTRPFVDSFKAAAKSGALMVVAAGNDNSNRDVALDWPTSINVPNSIKVAASDYYDNKADFSNYGLKTIDIFAPGKSILGAYIFSTSSQVGSFDGTSMSAPFVTGAIGLLCARDPSLTAPQIKQRLLASATHIEQLRPYVKDGLRLNVGALLDNAVHTITGTTTTISSRSTRPVSVAGISIYLDKTFGTPDAVTDSKGRYTIYGVKGGAHSVRAVLGTSAFGTTTKVNLPTNTNAVPASATANFVAQTPPSRLYFIAGKVIQTLPRLQTQPKANADIYLNDNPIPYTRSNAQGLWKIPNLPTGAYAVKVVDSVTGEVAPVVEVVTLPSPDPRSIYNPNSPSGYVETSFPYGDRIAPAFGTNNITDFQIYTPATVPQRFTGTLVDNTAVGLANFQLYRVKDDVATCYDWNSGTWISADSDAPELRVEGNGSATLNFDIALPELEAGYTYYIETNAPDVFGNLFSYESTFTVEAASASTKSSPKATKPKSSAPNS